MLPSIRTVELLTFDTEIDVAPPDPDEAAEEDAAAPPDEDPLFWAGLAAAEEDAADPPCW